jgi:predicted RNA-binding protein with PIN domain
LNYIIDGHNLIAQFPGLSLSMPDDEQRLVELLMLFCKPGRHKVEVYFDRAPVGQARVVNHGRVRAYFVIQHSSADDAIRRRLRALSKSAKTWAVVSSDRSVQAAAREAHAQVLSASEFATRLSASLQPDHPGLTPNSDEPLSEAEVREWEAFFRQGRKPK